jgi:hypothetical protein
MTSDIVSAGLVVLLWGYLIVKLQTLHWHLRDSAQRANCASLFAVGLSMTVFHPPIYRAVDRLTGVPNLSRLLGNSLGVIGAWTFQPVIVRLLRYPERKRGALGSIWLMIGTLASMAFFFSRASVPVEAPTDFQVRYSTAPYVAEYRLVVLAYIGLLVLQIFFRSIQNGRVIRSIPQMHLRVQARLQTLGWGLGVAYAGLEAGYILLALLGVVPRHAYPETLAYGLFASGLIALLSGGAVSIYHWGTQYRAYRRLYPLWRDLYGVTPGIALDPPDSARADALIVRNLGLRLYRRVMEIRDGVVALQRYTDANLRDRARALCRAIGVSEEDAPVCIEAMMWAAAVEAKRRARFAAIPIDTMVTHTDTNLGGEVQHLQRVARAYRRLAPHAATLVDEIADPRSLSTEYRSNR